MSDAADVCDDIDRLGKRINAFYRWADTLPNPEPCPVHGNAYVGRISHRCYHPDHDAQPEG